MVLPVFLGLALAYAWGQISQPSQAPTSQTVTGRVVEEGRLTPIASASVTLVTVQSGQVLSTAYPRPREVLTDQDGRFIFASIDAGGYVVNVQKAGYTNPTATRIPSRFTVVPGEQHVVPDFVLSRGAVITGRVLDPFGQPFADARVGALRPSSLPQNGPIRSPRLLNTDGSTQTNDIGEFRLVGLPGGKYYIQAAPLRTLAAAGPSPGMMIVPTFLGGSTDQATALTVSVAPSQTLSEVVIQLAVLPAFEVSGTVVDEAGQPVANAEVRLTLDPGDNESSALLQSFLRARSDGGGRFTIGGVTSGSYWASAAAPVIISPRPSSAPDGGVVYGSVSGNLGSHLEGRFVMTETWNGVTSQFREDWANRVAVSVNEANVAEVRVVARR